MNLAAFEAAVRSRVGAYIDIASWPVDVIDEGLRMALHEMSRRYPPVESEVTVATPGREQDLAGIAGLLEVHALAWPWTADASFNRLVCNWRPVGAGRVYIESGVPAAGDVLRVRHSVAFAVEDLDGAAETTAPAAAQALLVTGAAGYALLLRQRILSENPAVPKDAVENVQTVGERLLQTFTTTLDAMSPGGTLTWQRVGLEGK